MAELTEKEFSKHVNTKFLVTVDGREPIPLELVEVKNYAAGGDEQRVMERFSIFFKGPQQPFLPQATYSIQHEQMGDFELFIVPVGQDAEGFSYEAVFNYYKEKVMSNE